MNVDLAILILYAVLNCISFLMYGADKRKAVKNAYRISESSLLTAGFVGPFGALAGMKIFRHKTQKTKFVLVYVFAALHIVIFVLLILPSA